MADPIEIVMDFLRRHRFEQAEAAFKAELSSRENSDRPVLSSENVSDWDLQLRSPGSVGSAPAAPLVKTDGLLTARSPPEHDRSGVLYPGEKRAEEESQSGRVVSPPEKQLYVEYEPGKVKPQDSLPSAQHDFSFENANMSPESDVTVPFAGAYVSSPIHEIETAMQGASRASTGVMQSSSFSLRPVGNQARQANGDLDEKASTTGNELIQPQLASKPSTVFESLAGLSNRAKLQQLAQMEPLHIDDKADINSKNSTSSNESHDSKDNDKQGHSFLHNELKAPMPNFAANNEPFEANSLRDQHGSEGSQDNKFITRGTSGGPFKAPGLKNLLSFTFLKSGEYGLQDTPDFWESQSNTRRGFNETEKLLAVKEPNIGSRIMERRAENPDSGGEELPRDSGGEELPRLPPVRLHLIGKNADVLDNGRASVDSTVYRSMDSVLDDALGWSTLADGLSGQDLTTSGSKRTDHRPSVSHGIVDAMSDQLYGFTIAAKGQTEKWYHDEYCDSDTYEDDDDPGYLRQPIEDEEWFLAHEIDYPSDDERSRHHMDKAAVALSNQSKKLDEDDRSFVEEESYFSGEEYYRAQAAKKELYKLKQSEDVQATFSRLYAGHNDNNPLALSRVDGGSYEYDNQILRNEEQALVRSEPIWKGFVGQSNELDDQGELGLGGYRLPVSSPDAGEDDNRGSVVSGGIQVNSDAAEIGSEVRESLLGGSSEGDTESLREQELVSYGPAHDHNNVFSGRHVEEKSAPVQHLEEDDERDMILQYFDEAWGHTKRGNETGGVFRNKTKEQSKNKCLTGHSHKVIPDNDGFVFEGFSFPSPSSTGEIAASTAGSGKSIWSNRESPPQGEDADADVSGMVGPDDTLAAWKRKSSNSSPIICSSDENVRNRKVQHPCTDSIHSTDEYLSLEKGKWGNQEADVAVRPQVTTKPSAQEEEDAVAGQEEIRCMGLDEDQYEIFDLRIIHRKNRTGFEEEKEFPVIINSVVAGRYHVTEYLGSAAFSKAIQAHDLHTGMDVCMKIIKNNKDFFDQSLDEIKLLKFVNKHDPADKHHVLRLYDYFYHQEHLFIVCELLRANLYEFHKFNRESGGEVYFTMPRLQSITRQCLEGLEFLHGLGIIHCDLKPENILVKSYSRCEIKIIDLGSSCFQTDHLCSYVQSRSYRAPEVILGLRYDKKIDIWSLGCILAELCSGNVIFQNDSLGTLLARVVGILGPIDPQVLSRGRDTHKYFTKNHMLYERNQETDQLEYLLPKKTSLRHRLPMGDQGFVEFVTYLLQPNPDKRPTATEALQHPWLSYPYEPISS